MPCRTSNYFSVGAVAERDAVGSWWGFLFVLVDFGFFLYLINSKILKSIKQVFQFYHVQLLNPYAILRRYRCYGRDYF